MVILFHLYFFLLTLPAYNKTLQLTHIFIITVFPLILHLVDANAAPIVYNEIIIVCCETMKRKAFISTCIKERNMKVGYHQYL